MLGTVNSLYRDLELVFSLVLNSGSLFQSNVKHLKIIFAWDLAAILFIEVPFYSEVSARRELTV